MAAAEELVILTKASLKDAGTFSFGTLGEAVAGIAAYRHTRTAAAAEALNIAMSLGGTSSGGGGGGGEGPQQRRNLLRQVPMEPKHLPIPIEKPSLPAAQPKTTTRTIIVKAPPSVEGRQAMAVQTNASPKPVPPKKRPPTRLLGLDVDAMPAHAPRKARPPTKLLFIGVKAKPVPAKPVPPPPKAGAGSSGKGSKGSGGKGSKFKTCCKGSGGTSGKGSGGKSSKSLIGKKGALKGGVP
jgi:hypothetical protein